MIFAHVSWSSVLPASDKSWPFVEKGSDLELLEKQVTIRILSIVKGCELRHKTHFVDSFVQTEVKRVFAYLTQVDGEVDFIEANSSRQRRRLPPSFGPVDGKVSLVRQTRIIWITVVTRLALEDMLVHVVKPIGSDKLAVKFTSLTILSDVIFTTRCAGIDSSSFGQIE